LKERNDPRKISSLLLALRGTDMLARVSAIHDLGRVEDPQITKELLTLFRHPDPEVKLAAAKVLAVRDDTPPAHFLGLLLDTSPEVRLVAVQFFARIHAHQIAEVLVPLLSDPSLQVRQAAAAAIGGTGDVAAIEDRVVTLNKSNL
jgi:HEAT repeat protein